LVVGPRARYTVLAPIALAAFVTSLDNTVVNVALPSIQRDLRLGVSGLQWIASSYILAFSSLLLAGGRLTDLFGRRRVFLIGLTLFIAGSVGAGMATSTGFLLGARVAQGGGAALVLPATLAVLSADLAGTARHLGAGVFTAAIALALALGPVTGGAISQYWHWSGIFFLNVPLGLLTMGLGALTIGRSRPGGPARLDLGGLVTSTLAMAGLTYALIEGNRRGYASADVLLGLGLAVLGALTFVLVERQAPAPMVDVALFANRVFSGGTATQVLWGLGINGVFFFTSLFLQDVLRLPPTTAGALFVPLAAALIIVVPVASLLAGRVGAARTVGLGMALIAAGLVGVSTVGRGDAASGLLPGLVLIGLGSALTTPLTSAVLEVVPEAKAGVAAAVISAAREVSGVLGIALIGAIVGTQASFASGYALGLWFSAALTLLGGLIALRTLRPLPAASDQARPSPAARTGQDS
jgi:EmrB/QacA subfamily drug resistance transporter